MDDGVIVSLEAHLIFLWVASVAMTIIYFARAYIRWVCFGRLLAEDYLVGGALVLFIAMAATNQAYLDDMYNMKDAAEGTWTPGPTFMEDTKHALQAIGALSIIVHVGLWLIKASFLVLFYRLGNQIQVYLYTWWVLAVFVMGCGFASIGLNQYQCMFNDIDEIFATCLTPENLYDVHRKEIAASVLDVVSDLVLIVFPVWVLWSTRFSIRQKLVFSGIFCLVLFTIAIATVRGVFSKTIVEDPQHALRQINVDWAFWFGVEYVTSFMVACAISFRSLFVQHRNKHSAAEVKKRTPTSVQKHKNPFKYYLDKMSATLLSTAHFLEGHGYDHDTWKLPMPTSGLMTVDFSHDDGWRRMPERRNNDTASTEAFDLKDHGGKWDTQAGYTNTTTTVSSSGTVV
ncbi:hypothetical protein QBC37DRAFT_421741 [Rhypophila decipiens]|uniref:Rhodopsin domain-containing protein n=1 Tax=Rhypophila decipiens TaxID=261697 RepID=A0AAN7B8D1_9PEZI|nr:hypothetical protein QBC37DRAFT_421741 [Rhypophila decipiens]